MTDETQSDPIIGITESREGKLARKHKAAIGNILEELIEAMEVARADGFMVEFGVNQKPEGGYQVVDGGPVLIKRW